MAGNFTDGIRPFVSNTFLQKINGLFRGPFSGLIVNGENNSCGPMDAPKKHTHLFFICLGEPHVPKNEFPIQGPSFHPKWRSEFSVCPMALVHEIFQIMPWN